MAHRLSLKQHLEDAELRVQRAQRRIDRQREGVRAALCEVPEPINPHPVARLLENEGAIMAAKKTAAKQAAKSKTARRKAAKRELIDTGTNKLFVRRNARGTSFTEVVDVGRSLAADRRRHSGTVAKPGQGDKGDRQPSRIKNR